MENIEGVTVMLSIYPAVFFEEDSGYSVVFPDLDYLSTEGNSFEDAMEMAIDCLAGYLYSANLDDETVPEASEMKDIRINDIVKELGIDQANGMVSLVSVNVEEYAKFHFTKSVKKTLTIPKWLNDAAMKKNINFSKTLQEALLAKL